ncbi:hypothetical protein ACE6H2_005240 [Prunus campanulata]
MVLRHCQITSSSAPRREREGREIVAWILESFFFDEGRFAYSTSSDILVFIIFRPNSSNLKVFNELCPHAALCYTCSLMRITL